MPARSTSTSAFRILIKSYSKGLPTLQTRTALPDQAKDFARAARARLAERKRSVPFDEVRRKASERASCLPFREALTREGPALIAEHKRRSPSNRQILPPATAIADVVTAYERGGAAALSIVTAEDHWGGRPDDVDAARAASSLPILRKDFIIDPYQLHEARAGGADAVLLIARLLDHSQLLRLHAETEELGLTPLVEVHNRTEFERALEIGAEVVGINNRDLDSLDVDIGITEKLLDEVEVPHGTTIVSESGIKSHAEIRRLSAAGVGAFLVGGHLLEAADWEIEVKRLLGLAR